MYNGKDGEIDYQKCNRKVGENSVKKLIEMYKAANPKSERETMQ